MRYSLAIPTDLHDAAATHLLSKPRQEELCFALWYPSQGEERLSGMLHQLILPQQGERNLHGNVSFTAHYFQRCIGIARSANAGLALLHSHLGPGWQNMSEDDIKAENKHAPAAFGATGLPLLGMTLATDQAWSARFWKREYERHYERFWCESVRVVGQRMRVTYCNDLIPVPTFLESLNRTVSVWGEKEQQHLARLRIGIIGAGSVGFLVAEAIARMGVNHIKILDFDRVKKINLDRLLYATKVDAKKNRLKVEVLKKALKKSATAKKFVIDAIPFSICEEKGFRSALDCDVLFSCVDRPWARCVLNFIAFAHLIPVVDGGIRAEQLKTGNGIRRVNLRAHIAAPTRQCLECLEQYDPGLVSVERCGHLDNPAYIANLDKNHVFRQNENVFTFGMSAASLELLQFLRMAVHSPGLADLGADYYDFVTGSLKSKMETCRDTCMFRQLTAKGDMSGVVLTGRHEAAEKSRNE